MNRTSVAVIIAAILTCLSVIIISYRHFEYGLSFVPPESTDSWTIEARLFFKAEDKPAKVKFFLPSDNKNFSIVDEQFITQNYTTGIQHDEKTNNRMAIFENKRASGQQVLLYRVTVELEKNKNKELEKAADTKVKNQVAPVRNLKKPDIKTINYYKFNRAVANFITHNRKHSKDNREFVTNLIAKLRDKDDKLVAPIYAQLTDSTSSYLLLEYILNSAQIPYNKTHGFTLTTDSKKSFPFREWIDVFLDGSWVEIGPDGKLNENENPEQFRWWNGALPVMNVEGGSHSDIDIYYKQNLLSQTAKNIEKGAPAGFGWLQFPFAELPISTQSALEILLLIPIGALIVSFARQIIGISTYGTFMPILLAMAFRDIAPEWGLLLFTSIITIGLVTRSLIDGLQLLIVPKLSAIMTAMILGLAAFSLISQEIDISATVSIGLLPIVILSMLVERITVNWDEYGSKDTFMSGLGTVLTTCACLMVLNNNYVSHFVFNFPETLLFVFGIILLVGRYRGYKLFELLRFKHFLKN